MPRGIPNVKLAAVEADNQIRGIMANIAATEPGAPEPERMAVMRLDRHYRPTGAFEVVGHMRPEIRRKGPDGREVVIQAEEWVAGEMMPSPRPGAGTTGKVWAGTVIKIPVTEAKAIERAKIGAPTLAD